MLGEAGEWPHRNNSPSLRVHTTRPSRKPECCPAFENESGEPPFPRIRNTMATAPPPIAGARTKLWNLLHRSKREEQKTQSQGTRFKLMVMATGRRQAGPASLTEAINTHHAVYTAAAALSTPGLHPKVGGRVCTSQQPADRLLQAPAINTTLHMALFLAHPLYPKRVAGPFLSSISERGLDVRIFFFQ